MSKTREEELGIYFLKHLNDVIYFNEIKGFEASIDSEFNYEGKRFKMTLEILDE